MRVIDISSRSKLSIERELSNLTPRPFVLEDIRCGSIEGFLQCLKFESQDTQRYVATLTGVEAFRTGQSGNKWKEEQVLWWNGDPYCRHSLDYTELLTRAYDSMFDQNFDFQLALKSTVGWVLRHSMGKNDPCDTVLTEAEYIYQLERLRWRSLGE